MFYNYDITKRFSKKNADKYRYFLVDSHYKSNAITANAEGRGGQKFKAFFDDFCQYLFDINLTLGEDIGEFPIAYSEAQNSASVAIALSHLTPYVISEYPIYCKDAKIRDFQGNEKQLRKVDFWFRTNEGGNGNFEGWIERKHLWLKVDKNAECEFDAECTKRTEDAINQIQNIKTLQKYHNFKIALLEIDVYCNERQKPDINELDSIPAQVASSIAALSGADKNDNMGVLLGALDLRKNHNKKKDLSRYWGEGYLPLFVLLGAVVMV